MNAVFALRCLMGGCSVLVTLKGVSLVGQWPGAAQAAIHQARPDAPAGIRELVPVRPAQSSGTMDPPPPRPQPRSQAAPTAGPPAPAAEGGSPTSTQADETLAAALRGRRQQLDEREQSVATREAVLAATEKRLQARIDSLADLQRRIDASERAAKAREEAHWSSLARLYEAMRPREAAAVFNELDLPMLAQIVNRMREQKAATVFGAMEPERVRALTEELARMRASRPAL
jgi:flagellar motility protein MotE (MotC chaperone)